MSFSGSIVLHIPTMLSAACLTFSYSPAATIASIAAPIDGPSSDFNRCTLIPSTLAIIVHQSSLLAPPPHILVSVMLIPSDLAISKESLIANATPSSTACVISVLVLSIVIPVNVALASGSLCGERSPIRYGRKYI